MTKGAEVVAAVVLKSRSSSWSSSTPRCDVPACSGLASSCLEDRSTGVVFVGRAVGLDIPIRMRGRCCCRDVVAVAVAGRRRRCG
jgi:hypothetical protein